MSNQTRVSVAIATYNGELFLKEQLDSVLENLNENDEVIISDDNSTDSTIDIIKEYNDKRIFLIKGPGKGVIKNFENALNHCSGKYIFLCDQDDKWYNNKVDHMLDKLTQYDVVVHNARIFSSDDKINNLDFFSFRNCGDGFLKNIYKNTYIGCCMAFHSKILKDILPFPKNIPMHDQWIGLLCETKYSIYFDDTCLISYRRHNNNVSQFKHNSLLTMIKNRLWLLINVIKRRMR